MACAGPACRFLHLDALHLPPTEVHQTAARQCHEGVDALSPEVALHGATQRLGPADVGFGAHQFREQFFIK
jgi:hypothetical protein